MHFLSGAARFRAGLARRIQNTAGTVPDINNEAGSRQMQSKLPRNVNAAGGALCQALPVEVRVLRHLSWCRSCGVDCLEGHNLCRSRH